MTQQGMLCHLLAFAGFVFPVGHILGPLILWQMKKDESPFLDDHGREAVNFQISATIYGAACFLLSFVLIGLILFPVLGIFWLVVVIRAALAASAGESYSYPLSIPFVR